MRRLLATISTRIQGFVNQSEHVALAVGCASANTMPVIKIIEGLEEAAVSEWFWIFRHDFEDPVQYASAVVNDFSVRHEAVRLSMQQEGMPPWPAIPDPILSEETAPERRLRELMAFSRRLLPVPNGGAVVWVYFPFNLRRPGAFAALMMEVMKHEFPFPWCHHLRVIVRDDLSDWRFKGAVGKLPRWQWYEPDLSGEAVERSLAEEAADENLPLAERMNGLLVMAGMDYSHRRYQPAAEKYRLLLKYHEAIGNHPMTALALNGIGEVHRELGDDEEAGRCFEIALVPASAGKDPPIPIWLNIVLNLANLRFEQRRWAEAAGYYDSAEKLATLARNAQVKIRSLENEGVSQSMQGKHAEAIETWQRGAMIAEELNEEELRRSLLKRLSQIYRETRQVEKHRETEARLVPLGRAGD
ncbi:MAG TPA: tetratricopeptide repeat protein [Blastocatellia bacterium]|nr:tetratricopeptide repeat protein [Blastocatellia bacterium]